MRTDPHCPKNIKPDDYRFVVVRSREDALFGMNGAKIVSEDMEMTGGKFEHHSKGGCNICGAYMIDYAVFHHMPSNTYIVTGCDCAAKLDGGHEDDFRYIAQKRRAAAKRKEKTAAAADYLDSLGILDYVENMFFEGDIGGCVRNYNVESELGEDYTYRESVNEDAARYFGDEVANADAPPYMLERAINDFFTVVDMVRKLVKYGNWSDKQADFAVKLVENMKALPDRVGIWKAKEEARPDAPEGRIEIIGKVIGVKWIENVYGYNNASTKKIVVEADEGYKVYSTAPRAILGVGKGDKVKFTATLTRSDKDSKFAFAKRPTKAEVIEEAAA